jgi:hypothetical protein
MTEERLVLAELLEKAGDGDFLRAVAEAVLQLLMESNLEGLIGAGRYERSGERTTWRNGYCWQPWRFASDASSRRRSPRPIAIGSAPPQKGSCRATEPGLFRSDRSTGAVFRRALHRACWNSSTSPRAAPRLKAHKQKYAEIAIGLACVDEALRSDDLRVDVELPKGMSLNVYPKRKGTEERLMSEGREQQAIIESRKRSSPLGKGHNWDRSSKEMILFNPSAGFEWAMMLDW